MRKPEDIKIDELYRTESQREKKYLKRETCKIERFLVRFEGNVHKITSII